VGVTGKTGMPKRLPNVFDESSTGACSSAPITAKGTIGASSSSAISTKPTFHAWSR